MVSIGNDGDGRLRGSIRFAAKQRLQALLEIRDIFGGEALHRTFLDVSQDVKNYAIDGLGPLHVGRRYQLVLSVRGQPIKSVLFRTSTILQIANATLNHNGNGDLSGVLKFTGNLDDRAYVFVEDVTEPVHSQLVRKVSFVPAYDRLPYVIDGIFRHLNDGEVYNFVVESQRGGRIFEHGFRLS